eukprot:IDg6219t1
MNRSDPRRHIGARVSAKSIAVTSVSESKRLFGSLWKTATIKGVVQSVITPPRGSRRQTSLVVKWTIRETQKVKEVKLVNTKIDTTSTTTTTTTTGGNEITSGGQEVSTAVEITQPAENNNLFVPGNNVNTTQTEGETESATVSHGYEWVAGSIELALNGPVMRRYWAVDSVNG